jgi:hypothetical protein
MLVRLESELLRLLRNPSAWKLEMQPMTGYNASLVEAVAQYFELGFSFIDAEPDDVTRSALAPADRCQYTSRTVTLHKLKESKVPLLRLEELLPEPSARAAGSRDGAVPGKIDDKGTGKWGVSPRVESSDSLDSGKVQLMRRAKTHSQDKAPEPARLSADEVEARLRDKEAEYEAARRRIMGEGCAADAAAGVAAREVSGAAQESAGQPNGPGEAPPGESGPCRANGTVVGGSPSVAAAPAVAQSAGGGRGCGRVTTAIAKVASRAHDRNDPDYDRSRILRQGAGGRGCAAPASCCMGGAASMGTAERLTMSGAHGLPSLAAAHPGTAEMARLQLGVPSSYTSPDPASNPGIGYGVAGAYSPSGAGCGSSYAHMQRGGCALPLPGTHLGYGEFGTVQAPPSEQQPSFHHPPQRHQIPAHFNAVAGRLGRIGGGGGLLWPVAAGGFSAAYSAPPVGAFAGGHMAACASLAMGYGAPISAAVCNAHQSAYVGGAPCGPSHFGATLAEAPAARPGVMMPCAARPGELHPSQQMASAAWSGVLPPGTYTQVPGHPGFLPGAMLPGFAVPMPQPKPPSDRGSSVGRPCGPSPPAAAAASTVQAWQPPLPSGPPPQRT